MIICPMTFLSCALLGGHYYAHVNFLNDKLPPLKEQDRQAMPRNQEQSWMEFISTPSSRQSDNADSKSTDFSCLSYLPSTPLCRGKLLWTLWQIYPAFAPIAPESTSGIPLFSKAVTDSPACMYMHLNFQEFISALYMKWIQINENKKTVDEVNSNSVECSRKIRPWRKPLPLLSPSFKPLFGNLLITFTEHRIWP